MDIKSQEQWVLYNLEKFYSDPENFKKVANFIEEKSGLSLRLIDWFVTNYAKKYNTSFINSKGELVIVYLKYKSNLKGYNKRKFDPFCRSNKISFHNIRKTSVCQLTFFKWALEHEILGYLEKHKEEVQADMDLRNYSEEIAVIVGKSDTKKRHELSQSANKTMRQFNVPYVAKFNN